MNEPIPAWYQRPWMIPPWLVWAGFISIASAVGVGIRILLALNSWQVTAENRTTALEYRTARIEANVAEALVKAAEALVKAAVSDGRLVALETESQSDRRILLRMEEKVDMLIQGQSRAPPN